MNKLKNANVAEIMLNELKKGIELAKIEMGDNIIEVLDDAVKSKTWDNDIIIPHDTVLDIAYDEAGKRLGIIPEYLQQRLVTNAGILTALYTWRKYKKIYSFDKDLTEILFNQDISNMQIEPDFLKALPFNGLCLDIYIPENIFKQERGQRSNIIVCIDYDNVNKEKVLTFYIPFEIGDIGYTIVDLPLIKNITIKDGLRNYNKAYGKDFLEYKNYKIRNKAFVIIEGVINCLLYILSTNIDQKPSSITENTYRKPNPDFIKDKFREIEVLDIGTRIGSTIRMHRDRKRNRVRSLDEEKIYNSKSPHIRCGHWHYFWVGSRSDSSSRRRILKWIPPIFINGKMKEANMISISPVKKCKEDNNE